MTATPFSVISTIGRDLVRIPDRSRAARDDKESCRYNLSPGGQVRTGVQKLRAKLNRDVIVNRNPLLGGAGVGLYFCSENRNYEAYTLAT